MSIGQRKYSESVWGIEPQTLGFHALTLYHWATETLWWATLLASLIQAVCRMLIAYELHGGPCSSQSVFGLVVEHRRGESNGLRFDSLWGLRSFSTRQKKNFLYFFTQLRTHHLSYSISYMYLLSTFKLIDSPKECFNFLLGLKNLTLFVELVSNL